MANINAQELRALSLIIPDLKTQRAFAQLLSNMDCLVESLSKAKAKLDQLFQTLFHRAFSGDLTAKWREVHLKELLVEMEQQAKDLAAYGIRSYQEHVAKQDSLF